MTKRLPSKGEIEEAMDVIARHPTPTDLVALALTGDSFGQGRIIRCDFILHRADGQTIEVKGNEIA